MTAITKYLSLCCSNHRSLFSQFWRLEVQDQGVGRLGFFWGPFPLLTDSCLVCVSSHGFFPLGPCAPWRLLQSPDFPLQEHWLDSIRAHPHLLSHPSEGPISKYDHLLTYWYFNIRIWGEHNSAHNNYVMLSLGHACASFLLPVLQISP